MENITKEMYIKYFGSIERHEELLKYFTQDDEFDDDPKMPSIEPLNEVNWSHRDFPNVNDKHRHHVSNHSNQKNNIRRGRYKYYREIQLKKLFEYYFIDNATVERASELCEMNPASGYKYIRKMKLCKSITETFYNESRDQRSREELIDILCLQFDALKITQK